MFGSRLLRRSDVRTPRHDKLFSRLLTLGVSATVFVTSTSAALGFDARDYYPLEVGTSWRYEVETNVLVVSGVERIEGGSEQWMEDRVLGPSPFSTVGNPVYKVRTRGEIRARDTEEGVTKERVSHLSATKAAIRDHGVDSVEFEVPRTILEEWPSTDPYTVRRVPIEELNTVDQLVTILQLGSLEITWALKSQSTGAVEVPAGKFRKSIKQVRQGSVHGELFGRPVRVGSATSTTWYAKGVGFVRQHRVYYIKVRTLGGQDIVVSQTSTTRLTDYKRPSGQ